MIGSRVSVPSRHRNTALDACAVTVIKIAFKKINDERHFREKRCEIKNQHTGKRYLQLYQCPPLVDVGSCCVHTYMYFLLLPCLQCTLLNLRLICEIKPVSEHKQHQKSNARPRTRRHVSQSPFYLVLSVHSYYFCSKLFSCNSHCRVRHSISSHLNFQLIETYSSRRGVICFQREM